MEEDGSGRALRVDAALAVAVEHVRLAYHYLDTGDLDGYGSLFEAGALPAVPERPPARRGGARERHEVAHVFGSGRRLAAVGRMVDADRRVREFVDLFTVSDRALFVHRRRFTAVAESDGVSVR